MNDRGGVTGSSEPEPPFEFKRPAWQARAACHPSVLPREVWEPWGKHPVDMFFPQDNPTSPSQRQAIRTVCCGCPVRVECEEHAVAHESDGFWAGNGSVKLRLLRRERGIRRQTPEVDESGRVIGTYIEEGHGSVPRYKRHLSDGTPPCELCKFAWASFQQRAR